MDRTVTAFKGGVAIHRCLKSDTEKRKITVDTLKKIPSVVWIVCVFVILVVVGIATS